MNQKKVFTVERQDYPSKSWKYVDGSCEIKLDKNRGSCYSDIKELVEQSDKKRKSIHNHWNLVRKHLKTQ